MSFVNFSFFLSFFPFFFNLIFKLFKSFHSLLQMVKRFKRFLSKQFIPLVKQSTSTTSSATSSPQISYNLLRNHGFIRQTTNTSGHFSILPLGTRVVDKIVNIIESELEIVGCSKLSLPILTPKELLVKTNRWSNETQSEMFKLEDRKGRSFCLAPTCEESITDLVKHKSKPNS